MARTLVLIGSLLLIGLLAFLSFTVLFRDGVDVLVVLSLILLALLGFGVIGALTEKRPGDE
jgi:hypothetical protein